MPTRWLWVAIAFQVLTGLFSAWTARRNCRDWRRLRALNQIVWAYTKELLEKGVTLPPRCVMCVQILPRHVDGCLMQHAFDEQPPRPRIKYYPKGEHPPHPEEEEPPPHA